MKSVKCLLQPRNPPPIGSKVFYCLCSEPPPVSKSLEENNIIGPFFPHNNKKIIISSSSVIHFETNFPFHFVSLCLHGADNDFLCQKSTNSARFAVPVRQDHNNISDDDYHYGPLVVRDSPLIWTMETETILTPSKRNFFAVNCRHCHPSRSG